jgi:hypothetical protein
VVVEDAAGWVRASCAVVCARMVGRSMCSVCMRLIARGTLCRGLALVAFGPDAALSLAVTSFAVNEELRARDGGYGALCVAAAHVASQRDCCAGAAGGGAGSVDCGIAVTGPWPVAVQFGATRSAGDVTLDDGWMHR